MNVDLLKVPDARHFFEEITDFHSNRLTRRMGTLTTEQRKFVPAGLLDILDHQEPVWIKTLGMWSRFEGGQGAKRHGSCFTTDDHHHLPWAVRSRFG